MFTFNHGSNMDFHLFEVFGVRSEVTCCHEMSLITIIKAVHISCSALFPQARGESPVGARLGLWDLSTVVLIES